MLWGSHKREGGGKKEGIANGIIEAAVVEWGIIYVLPKSLCVCVQYTSILVVGSSLAESASVTSTQVRLTSTCRPTFPPLACLFLAHTAKTHDKCHFLLPSIYYTEGSLNRKWGTFPTFFLPTFHPHHFYLLLLLYYYLRGKGACGLKN